MSIGHYINKTILKIEEFMNQKRSFVNFYDKNAEFKSGDIHFFGIAKFEEGYKGFNKVKNFNFTVKKTSIIENDCFIIWECMGEKDGKNIDSWGISYFEFSSDTGLITKNYWNTSHGKDMILF